MYGLIGAANFSPTELNLATNTKKQLSLQTDPIDEIAYKLGYELTGDVDSKEKSFPTNITDLCDRFKVLLGRYPNVLQVSADGGGYVTPKTCSKCHKKTKETRHGGSLPGRLAP